MFLCYYCAFNGETLTSVIEHCTENHSNYVLKYKENMLDPEKGYFVTQTKVHENIIPINLSRIGKTIQVDQNCVYIKDKQVKKKRLSTPVKSTEHYVDDKQYFKCSYCKFFIKTLLGIVSHLDQLVGKSQKGE